MKITCFVSCRYTEEDNKIVKYITQFLDALGFNIYIADKPDIRSPQEKVKGEIKNCDCLCAIATKKDKINSINK
jgi:hypothetical protein